MITLHQDFQNETKYIANLTPYAPHPKSEWSYNDNGYTFNDYALASIILFGPCYIGDDDDDTILSIILEQLNATDPTRNWTEELNQVLGNPAKALELQEVLVLPHSSSLHYDIPSTINRVNVKPVSDDAVFMATALVRNGLGGNGMAIGDTASIVGEHFPENERNFVMFLLILEDETVSNLVINLVARNLQKKLDRV